MTRPTIVGLHQTARKHGTRLIRLAVLAMLVVAWPAARADAQGQVTEQRDTLPDGTVYSIQVPANWNKVLIRDLDFAGRELTPRYTTLLDKGYAVAGTLRHRLRMYQYDPAREIANLDRVLDLFEARFGKPSRVIQFGCSGGGHVTQAVAEDFSDRIDGAIAMAAHTPVWLMNTFLDGWFVLKTLLTVGPEGSARSGPGAPTELMITGFSNNEPFDPTGHGVGGRIPAAWRAVIDAAQQTPQGRARIALAFAVGQWSPWMNNLTDQPDWEDAKALQHSMYHAAFQNAANPGGEARVMFENAANGQQLSWNTGVDYAAFYENANPLIKRAVEGLYREAGLDIKADLGRVNSAPRVEASGHALEFWKAPGRTVRGNPKIPMLRLHEIGDPQVPISLVQGYEVEIKANGKDDLYRRVVVNAPTHCGFNPAETGAAVEVMMKRLDTGRWISTTPEDMNSLGVTLATGATPRFVGVEKFQQLKYNRVWIP